MGINAFIKIRLHKKHGLISDLHFLISSYFHNEKMLTDNPGNQTVPTFNTLRNKLFENIVGKGRNAGNRLLFSHASAEVRSENMPQRKLASIGYQTHRQQVMSPTRSCTTEPPRQVRS